ncbi:hypothetical protein ABK040_003616 [Willaertia magna]
MSFNKQRALGIAFGKNYLSTLFFPACDFDCDNNYKQQLNNDDDQNVLDDISLDIPLASREIQQFVAKVLDYESYYNESQIPKSTNFSPYHIVGKPTMYPLYKNDPSVFCPSSKTGTNYVIVQFEKPVLVKKVNIYETLGAGSVSEILALNMNSLDNIMKGLKESKSTEEGNKNKEEEEEGEDKGLKEEERKLFIEGTLDKPLTNKEKSVNKDVLEAMEWITLWKGDTTSGHEEARIFSPPLLDEDVFTNVIRINLTLNGEWSEIDAIQLEGITIPEWDSLRCLPSLREINRYLTFMKFEEYSDVLLVHKQSGYEVKAHAGLLASRCSVLRERIQKLYNNSQTISNDNTNKEPIRLFIEDDISLDCFKGIVEYLYCNRISLCEENLVPIVQFARNYKLRDLEQYCGQLLYISLTKRNVLDFYKITKEYTYLNEMVLKCMKDNFNRVYDIKNLDKVLMANEKKKIVTKTPFPKF